ncbi:MAG: hypothetical protein INR73_14215 [Williamsia sp.]|nr:hypothetical protein [Williamsia sp.]
MRLLFAACMFFSLSGFGQPKSFMIGVKGDTLNVVDAHGQKQGKWVIHHEPLRGEPGFDEEGQFKDDRREGQWRRYSQMGDLTATENYRWGNKDGQSMYFNNFGDPVREENWKAINPDKVYDTLEVEDVEHLGHFKRVVVKNEGAGIRHGLWKYYDPRSGLIVKTENYVLGVLEGKKKDAVASAGTEKKAVDKPQEVLDWEKKNAGKKKIKVRTGSTVN